jgi:hypothetical protein
MDPNVVTGIAAASFVLIVTLVIIFNPGADTGVSASASLTGVRLGSGQSSTATPPSGGPKTAFEQYKEALQKYW